MEEVLQLRRTHAHQTLCGLLAYTQTVFNSSVQFKESELKVPDIPEVNVSSHLSS